MSLLLYNPKDKPYGKLSPLSDGTLAKIYTVLINDKELKNLILDFYKGKKIHPEKNLGFTDEFKHYKSIDTFKGFDTNRAKKEALLAFDNEQNNIYLNSLYKALSSIYFTNSEKYKEINEQLLSTGNSKIIYQSNNIYLGLNEHKEGMNVFGDMLMNIRKTKQIQIKKDKEIYDITFKNRIYSCYVALLKIFLNGEDDLEDFINLNEEDYDIYSQINKIYSKKYSINIEILDIPTLSITGDIFINPLKIAEIIRANHALKYNMSILDKILLLYIGTIARTKSKDIKEINLIIEKALIELIAQKKDEELKNKLKEMYKKGQFKQFKLFDKIPEYPIIKEEKEEEKIEELDTIIITDDHPCSPKFLINLLVNRKNFPSILSYVRYKQLSFFNKNNKDEINYNLPDEELDKIYQSEKEIYKMKLLTMSARKVLEDYFHDNPDLINLLIYTKKDYPDGIIFDDKNEPLAPFISDELTRLCELFYIKNDSKIPMIITEELQTETKEIFTSKKYKKYLYSHLKETKYYVDNFVKYYKNHIENFSYELAINFILYILFDCVFAIRNEYLEKISEYMNKNTDIPGDLVFFLESKNVSISPSFEYDLQNEIGFKNLSKNNLTTLWEYSFLYYHYIKNFSNLNIIDLFREKNISKILDNTKIPEIYNKFNYSKVEKRQIIKLPKKYKIDNETCINYFNEKAENKFDEIISKCTIEQLKDLFKNEKFKDKNTGEKIKLNILSQKDLPMGILLDEDIVKKTIITQMCIAYNNREIKIQEEKKNEEFIISTFSENILKQSDKLLKQTNINYRKLSITEESKYSSLLPWHIESVRNIFKQWFQKSKVSFIIDATAHIGVDTLNFCEMFPNANIYSFEINEKVVPLLKENTKSFDKVKVFDKDFLLSGRDISDKKASFIYIDPPWGGESYKNYENLDLFLRSGINVIRVVLQLLITEKTDTVILKVPKNYNFKGLVPFFGNNIERKDVLNNKNSISFVLLKLTLTEELLKRRRLESLIMNAFISIFNSLQKIPLKLSENDIKYAAQLLYPNIEENISIETDHKLYNYDICKEIILIYMPKTDIETENLAILLDKYSKFIITHSSINKKFVNNILLYQIQDSYKAKDTYYEEDFNKLDLTKRKKIKDVEEGVETFKEKKERLKNEEKRKKEEKQKKIVSTVKLTGIMSSNDDSEDNTNDTNDNNESGSFDEGDGGGEF